MKNGSRQTRQFAGFIQTQQRQQQASSLYAGRRYTPGDVAPDGYARNTRQRTDLCRGIVGTVTPQQHRFTGVVTADKPGHHQTFAR